MVFPCLLSQVAYIPPTADIGPESRLVRFAYTIEDSSANKLYGQTFDIEILPVNNQVMSWCVGLSGVHWWTLFQLHRACQEARCLM